MNCQTARAASYCACLAIGCSVYTVDIGSAQSNPSWTTVFDIETRYFSWERTKGNLPGQPQQKGTQSYTPFSLQTVGLPTDTWKIELFARGGYVDTSRSALPFAPMFGVPFSTGNVATATDTLLTGTATYLGLDGFQPFYALNLNLPTGETVLLGKKGIARTDPDLVDIPSFGEGFNQGYTIGANIPITTDIMATFSAGYTNKGTYDREVGDPLTLNGALLPLDRVGPGNNTALSANLAAAFGQFSFNLSAAMTFYDPDRVNGVKSFENGRNYFFTGTAAYKWDQMWTSTFTASDSHTQKLYLANPATGVLIAEPFNSNSDLVRLAFTHALAWRSFVFSGNVGYMRRDANEYDPLAQSFVPAKTRWSAGGGVKYVANDKLTFSARVERFWIDEDVKPDFTPFVGFVNGLPMSYDGWMIAVGLTSSF